MKTYFEYTISPSYVSPAYLYSQVINEGYAEETFDELIKEHREFLLECKDNPSKMMNFGEYQILNELALQIKFKWRNAKKLKIYFSGGSVAVHNRVLEIISEWSANCSLTFEKTEDNLKSDIRIGFNGIGYWSYIGTYALVVAKTEMTMNLQTTNGIDINGDEFKRLTLHEFGHALGLVHEHQRPDVDIEWDTVFVNNYFKTTYNWTDAMIKQNLYDVFAKDEVNSSDKVDTFSIMAYVVPKEFFKTKGIEFTLNYGLSEVDKQHIKELYPIKHQLLKS